MNHYYIETSEYSPRTFIVSSVLPKDVCVEMILPNEAGSVNGTIYRVEYQFVTSNWVKCREASFICLSDKDIYEKRELMYSPCDWLPSGYIPV